MSLSELDPATCAFLIRTGLIDAAESPICTRLTGGVSSDIWKIETQTQCFVIKRALAKLRVAQDWRAPVERNASEVAWLRLAGDVAPAAVPRVLGHDPTSGCFAMAYLDPATYPVWKAELASGRVDPGFAAMVGNIIGKIHAATADDPKIAVDFSNDAVFHSIRLEPYLLATVRHHPDLAEQLSSLATETAGIKKALMHGDVSPKNILVGPAGPVLLDAECACYGDPAFDLAFCLNHLLLKCLWVPAATSRLLAAFDAMSEAYLAKVNWETPDALQARTARLLPALLLARVDGKSPAEYITSSEQIQLVRDVARPLVKQPPTRLENIRDAWRQKLRA